MSVAASVWISEVQRKDATNTSSTTSSSRELCNEIVGNGK